MKATRLNQLIGLLLWLLLLLWRVLLLWWVLLLQLHLHLLLLLRIGVRRRRLTDITLQQVDQQWAGQGDSLRVWMLMWMLLRLLLLLLLLQLQLLLLGLRPGRKGRTRLADNLNLLSALKLLLQLKLLLLRRQLLANDLPAHWPENHLRLLGTSCE